jgi:hypothetical protein
LLQIVCSWFKIFLYQHVSSLIFDFCLDLWLEGIFNLDLNPFSFFVFPHPFIVAHGPSSTNFWLYHFILLLKIISTIWQKRVFHSYARCSTFQHNFFWTFCWFVEKWFKLFCEGRNHICMFNIL